MNEDFSTLDVVSSWVMDDGDWNFDDSDKMVSINSGDNWPYIMFSELNYRDTVLKGEFGSHFSDTEYF